MDLLRGISTKFQHSTHTSEATGTHSPSSSAFSPPPPETKWDFFGNLSAAVKQVVNDAAESIQTTAKDLANDLQQTDFSKAFDFRDPEDANSAHAPRLPWEQCLDLFGDQLGGETSLYSESRISEELRLRILAIPLSIRKVADVSSPEPPSTFPFSMADHLRRAQRLLQVDRRLGRLRFLLVPKRMKEEQFWFYYFYKIHLVIQGMISEVTDRSLPRELSEAQIIQLTDPALAIKGKNSIASREGSSSQHLHPDHQLGLDEDDDRLFAELRDALEKDEEGRNNPLEQDDAENEIRQIAVPQNVDASEKSTPAAPGAGVATSIGGRHVVSGDEWVDASDECCRCHEDNKVSLPEIGSTQNSSEKGEDLEDEVLLSKFEKEWFGSKGKALAD